MSLTMRVLPGLDQLGDTTALLYREYGLVATVGLDAAAADTVSYKGTAMFRLVQTGFNLWAIREWTDLRETAGVESWADFKNGFR